MKNIFYILSFVIISLFFASISCAKKADTKMYFYIGGYLRPWYKVNVKNNEILYRKTRLYDERDLEWEILNTDEAKIKKFIESIKIIGVDKWEKLYEDKNILDGTNYNIYIKYGDLEISVIGINRYPNKFDDFLNAVQELIGKKEFK